MLKWRTVSVNLCCCVTVMVVRTPHMLVDFGLDSQLWYLMWTEKHILIFAPPTHVGQQVLPNKKLTTLTRTLGAIWRHWSPSRSSQHFASCQSELFNQTHAGVCHCRMKRERRGWLRGGVGWVVCWREVRREEKKKKNAEQLAWNELSSKPVLRWA